MVFSTIISKVKGEEYAVDPGIPTSYWLGLASRRGLMLVRGLFSNIRRSGLFFRGRGVTIRAGTLIEVGAGVTFDEGSFIDALSKEGVYMGNNVSLGKRSVIECSGNYKHLGKGIQIGNNVGLGRDAFYGCAGGIKIGDDTIIGNFVSMHSENHNFSLIDTPIRLQGVNHQGIVVGNNCWIGAKVTILDGVTLGDGCIVAAGAVLIRGNYPANGIYGGNPAKLIKSRS